MPFFGGIALGIVTAVLVLVVLVLFGFETVWSVRQAMRHPTATDEALRKHDRAAGSLGRAAAIVGWAASVAVIDVTDHQGSAMLPFWVGGTAGLAILMVVEQRWPAPGGTARTAELRPRRVADVLPRAGLWIAGIAVLLAVASIVACGVLGSVRAGVPGAVTATSAWPGWRRSGPGAFGLAAITLLVAAVVRQLLRRPALAGFDHHADLVYRRSGVDRALRVLSFLGFAEFASLLGEMKDAAFDAGVDYAFVTVLAWASIGTFCAALVSIPAFRTHPPYQTGPTPSPVAVQR